MAKKKIDKGNLPTIVETGNNPLAYKDEFATVRQPFNQAQLELLSTMANLQSEADLIELKQTIARFFAERADREMERLWEDGTINEETLKSWEHEQMRTPYRTNITVTA